MSVTEPLLFEQPRRNDVGVYWPATRDAYGQHVPGTAVPFACRWDDDAQEVTLATGEPYITRAKVYPDIVMEVGGFIWHGDPADAPEDPRQEPLAYKVMKWSATKNMSGEKVLYTAWI